MRCQIGSLTVDFTNPPPTHFQHLTRQPATSEAVDLTIVIETVAEIPNEFRPFTQPGIWGVYRPTHRCVLDTVARTLHLTLPQVITAEVEYWFQRDFFASLGSISGQPLLHSSAVIIDGQGLAFCAESGTGKSTLMRNLSPFVETVNDETNWVFFKDNQWFLVNQNYYFGRSDEAAVPMGGFFLLNRGTEASVGSHCSITEAFPLALAVHLPFDKNDPFLGARAEASTRLLAQVPTHHFYASLHSGELLETLQGFVQSHAL